MIDEQNIKNGMYCKVIGKDDSIIVAGLVKQIKYCIGSNRLNDSKTSHILIHQPYITFDYKYFFHFHSSKYRIEDNIEEITCQIDFKNYLMIDMWTPDRRQNKKEEDFYDIDIFTEFTKDELDPEIKDLVQIINEIGFMTTASCCGHNGIFPHIIICIKSIYELNILKHIITDIKLLDGIKITLNDQCEEFKVFNSMNSGQKLVKLEIHDKSDSYVKYINDAVIKLQKFKGLL